MKEIKKVVQEKYSLIAKQANATSCCDTSGCCSSTDYTTFNDSYNHLDGYHPDADLSLGCGIPTQFANIREGDHVLDLGSGAGNDCFVARAIVGETGQVTGLDFTEAMLTKANENLQKLGYTNVSFVQGDIEAMPLADALFDVVVSNCVLNLVPDKPKAFAEIMRVIKPGGHFCVSDVVIKGVLPDKLRKDAEMYAGCVSGAITQAEYMQVIESTGFTNITLHKEKEIVIPTDILENYINQEEMKAFQSGETGIYSITVSGYKSV